MDEIDARLPAIAERFAAAARDSTAAIKAALDREDWSELARLCHSLAGRAGMFGHAEIGEAARAVEEGLGAGLSRPVVAALTRDLLDRMALLDRS